MDHLYKVFRKLDGANYEKEYVNRIQFPTTVNVNLKIKPMNNNNQYELYYLPSKKIHTLIANIYQNDNEIKSYIEKLPEVAKQKFILETIADELLNTNEIEGVRSTREEIVRSVKNIASQTPTKDRFSSMVHSYMKLSYDELTKLKDAPDVRKIYDLLLEEEINNEDLPDGEIFRAENCEVLRKSGTQKVIHKGVFPESKIIEKINELIVYLNNETDESLLIRVAITHYYFGYIHPFYDGNGRCSRFISSMYLKEEFSSLTAVSLSKGCNAQKNKYLEAFDVTNKVINRGELNFFIETFLEILKESQEDVIAQLKEKEYILDNFYELLINDKYFDGKQKYVLDIFFVLGQDTLFSSEKGLSVSDLSKIFKLSEQTIRKVLKDLEAHDKIDDYGKKPKLYFISDKYFE
ncbi:Fic family protein [Ureibacillus sinduriensis]|uniref:Fido domain-containing protein n=1 Tax=Ureibacillus sinduriensis BLB-1 = JCM 15800 TaxID=1384057 RepID=A0A0A3HX50_9BACL|nr:Fic family protein [Ureibacillus sinduriensis]KGR77196.1 hypothetical protein CD33_03555 [Ureibacillus sinduriensis BLB-1 = JCM 15800]